MSTMKEQAYSKSRVSDPSLKVYEISWLESGASPADVQISHSRRVIAPSVALALTVFQYDVPPLYESLVEVVSVVKVCETED